jgi:hypothetical protein
MPMLDEAEFKAVIQGFYPHNLEQYKLRWPEVRAEFTRITGMSKQIPMQSGITVFRSMDLPVTDAESLCERQGRSYVAVACPQGLEFQTETQHSGRMVAYPEVA